MYIENMNIICISNLVFRSNFKSINRYLFLRILIMFCFSDVLNFFDTVSVLYAYLQNDSSFGKHELWLIFILYYTLNIIYVMYLMKHNILLHLMKDPQ